MTITLPKSACAMLAMAACMTAQAYDGKIVVDQSKRGADVNPQMYGIFFEEINHSGDGGLYAELLKNRNFEEAVLPSGTTLKDGFAVGPHKPSYTTGRYNNWKVAWDVDSLKMDGWRVAGRADYDVTSERPLHPNTPNAMRMVMHEGGVELVNTGYWGVAVKAGETYNVRFYVCADSYQGHITAAIKDEQGRIVAKKKLTARASGQWQEFTAQLKPSATTRQGTFSLIFSQPGTVYVDYVSLFPQHTFKQRPNGMRADVAQALADLKPGFIRWPGGCIAEGATLDNRAKWKETLGDPMTRRSEWILWNYHCSWGFGYHEFLQLCEDVGADGMFVANVGLSCEVRNGDYTNDIEPYIQDICDAIEYARGDVSTTWGARRAEAGHPAPFNLKYVELGNEQIGDLYAHRYNYIYSVLKERYPDITFISTLGLGKTLDKLDRVDMIDPHWYVNPTFFYENDRLFDSVDRGKYDIYVGEYAAISAANMDGALSEAAFITGMERNSDLVKIASYAPLLENSHRRDWPTNLIWVTGDQVMARASYYVQQMFSHNVPTYNVAATLSEHAPSAFGGHVGVGGGDYRNFRLTDKSGRLVAQADGIDQFHTVTTKPVGRMRMTTATTLHMLSQLVMGEGTIEFEARPVEQTQLNPYTREQERVVVYPSLIFGADNDMHNFTTLHLGSQGSSPVVYLGRTIGGEAATNREPKGPASPMVKGMWSKVRVECGADGLLTCYVNGNKVFSQKVEQLTKHYAIAGYDEHTGETIIKVVNASEKPFATQVELSSTPASNAAKAITLAADSMTAENSFDQPTRIAPVENTFSVAGKKFAYTFAPRSFTVLRLKTSEK